MTRSWDAATYHRIDTPMRRWAARLIDELALRGDEVVLDAGCGSGQVTTDLAARLPRGRVHAVDASPEMIAELERDLPENVVAHLADLADFTLPEPVDLVFCNAVLHWIRDAAAAFRCFAAAARPGARLRAQCGAPGNLDAVLSAAAAVKRTDRFAAFFAAQPPHVYFRSAEEMTALLRAAGWEQVRAWTEEAPAALGNRDETVRYLRTVILRLDVEALPEPDRAAYLGAVYDAWTAAHGGPFVADYVRLNLAAVR